MLLAAIRVLKWGLLIGGIGFVAGFFGPMVLNPGANQGPLLGIFITGPLGLLVGLAVGFVRELLGHPTAPEGLLDGRRTARASNGGTPALRVCAMVGGGFLLTFGGVGVFRGEGRGAAAAIVIAAALIHYGATGGAPRWFRR